MTVMELQKRRIVHEYKYRWFPGDPNDHREAVITFVDGKFSECKFFGCCHTYTALDWMFLGHTAKMIAELIEAGQRGQLP